MKHGNPVMVDCSNFVVRGKEFGRSGERNPVVLYCHSLCQFVVLLINLQGFRSRGIPTKDKLLSICIQLKICLCWFGKKPVSRSSKVFSEIMTSADCFLFISSSMRKLPFCVRMPWLKLHKRVTCASAEYAALFGDAKNPNKWTGLATGIREPPPLILK